jgi:hypothetical protein
VKLYSVGALKALVAQWTRARGYELRCRGFESLLAQLGSNYCPCPCTGVAELVDARDLGSRVHDVRVRVSPPVSIDVIDFVAEQLPRPQ